MGEASVGERRVRAGGARRGGRTWVTCPEEAGGIVVLLGGCSSSFRYLGTAAWEGERGSGVCL